MSSTEWNVRRWMAEGRREEEEEEVRLE